MNEEFAKFTQFTLRNISGHYYGLNNISKNLIIIDRNKLKTPSFVLGTSGSGKK